MKKYYDDMFKEYSKDCKKNFASINSVLGRRRNLAKKFSDYLTEKTDENFVFANMTPDIINDAINKLKNKNSSVPDNISTNLLKLIMSSIMDPICHLFNMPFNNGYIPTVSLLSDFPKDLIYVPCGISQDWIVRLPSLNALHNKKRKIVRFRTFISLSLQSKQV